MANKMRLIDAEKAYEEVVGLSGQASTKSAYAAFWTVGKIIKKLPTVDAVPVPHNPCGFCGKFEFDSAKAVVGQHGARIVLACASTRYPIEEQFNFCPVCGRSLKEGVEDAAD